MTGIILDGDAAAQLPGLKKLVHHLARELDDAGNTDWHTFSITFRPVPETRLLGMGVAVKTIKLVSTPS